MATVTDVVSFEIRKGTSFVFQSNPQTEVITSFDEGFGFEMDVPNSTVDLQIPFNGPTNLKRIYVVSDRAVTLKFVTPGFTVLTAQPFTLVANVPSFLATIDVTALYVSNATGSSARLQLGAAGDDATTPPGPADVTVGGDLTVLGKINVSGLVDPTGVVFVRQSAADITGLPYETIFVDDSDDTVKFKNATGGITSLGGGGSGGVISVTASGPLTSSGGTDPDIAIPAADGSHDGYLTMEDWTTFSETNPTGTSDPTPNTVARRDSDGNTAFNRIIIGEDGILSTGAIQIQSAGQDANIGIDAAGLSIYLNPDPTEGQVVIQGELEMQSNIIDGALALQLSNGGGLTSGTADPTITPTAGSAGQLYIKTSSTVGLFIKQDSGTTTNWSAL